MVVVVCVYANSRNAVPRVAHRYGTIAAYTRRRASVRVVFVVFCMHMYSFAGLIRRTPQPTFSDTAITDRHSDTTIFQLRAHWVRISWSIGSEKSFGHVPPVGVEPSTSCVQGKPPIHYLSHEDIRWNSSSVGGWCRCKWYWSLGAIDQHLTFDTHIETKVNKANSVIEIVWWSFTYLDEEMFRLLLKALVRSHLEWAQSVWCPYLKKQIELIENVQRRSTQ